MPQDFITVYTAAGATQVRAKKSRIMRKQSVCGILFLAPSMLLFVVFTVIPVVMGMYIAFCDYNLRDPVVWSGLANMKWIWENKIYLHSLLNVLVYVVFFVPQTIILSLLAANLLNRKARGIKVFRVLYYLPAVTSGIAVAFVWKWMFNEYYGLFNAILPGSLKWQNSSSYFAMFAISMVTVWTSIGGNMLVFLAGLQGISPELYEAAAIDGANGFQKLVRITVPLLAPTIYFVLTMSLIGAFQLFDVVQMMGAGNYYTQTPVTMIYGAFGKLKGGRAAAESLILFAVIMIVTFITQGITKLVSKTEV